METETAQREASPEAEVVDTPPVSVVLNAADVAGWIVDYFNEGIDVYGTCHRRLLALVNDYGEEVEITSARFGTTNVSGFKMYCGKVPVWKCDCIDVVNAIHWPNNECGGILMTIPGQPDSPIRILDLI